MTSNDVDVDALAEEAALAHYGVLGMKWGKRSASTTGGARKATSQKPPKPTGTEIRAARYRQELRLRKFQESQGDFYVARGAKGKTKAEKIMRQHEKTLFTNPDAATANKLTKGEKITTGIMLGTSALVVVGAIASAAANARRYPR